MAQKTSSAPRKTLRMRSSSSQRTNLSVWSATARLHIRRLNFILPVVNSATTGRP